MTRGSKVHCSQGIGGTPRPLPADHESALLRIGKEALTNAMRHSHPARIVVSLRSGIAWITFTVRADGCGFDVGERVGKGFGLAGMP